jgi:hypothetical protein
MNTIFKLIAILAYLGAFVAASALQQDGPHTCPAGCVLQHILSLIIANTPMISTTAFCCDDVDDPKNSDVQEELSQYGILPNSVKGFVGVQCQPPQASGADFIW